MMNIKISKNDSKYFGIILSIILIIYCVYDFYINELQILLLLFTLTLILVSLFKPSILNPITKIWVLLGITLGKIISPIVLGLVFFIVVTPTSLIRKIIVKDPINQKINKKLKTYWQKTNSYDTNLKNQF